jgi:hypothetical protein
LLDFVSSAHATTKIEPMLGRDAAQVGLDSKVVQAEQLECVLSSHDFLRRFSLSDLKIELNTSGLVVSGSTMLTV